MIGAPVTKKRLSSARKVKEICLQAFSLGKLVCVLDHNKGRRRCWMPVMTVKFLGFSMGNSCDSTATVPSFPPLSLQLMQATPARAAPRGVTSLPHHHQRRLTPTVRRVLSDNPRYAPRRYVIVIRHSWFNCSKLQYSCGRQGAYGLLYMSVPGQADPASTIVSLREVIARELCLQIGYAGVSLAIIHSFFWPIKLIVPVARKDGTGTRAQNSRSQHCSTLQPPSRSPRIFWVWIGMGSKQSEYQGVHWDSQRWKRLNVGKIACCLVKMSMFVMAVAIFWWRSIKGMCSYVRYYCQKPWRWGRRNPQLERRWVPLKAITIYLAEHSTVVPVILVATKFDLVDSEVFSAGGDTRTAHAKYEESRRSLFRGKLRDVPVEIVSSTCPSMHFAWKDPQLILFYPAKQKYGDLLESLITTTHNLITADSRNTSLLSKSSETREGNFQINPVSFVFSIEQRVNRNLIIQASIELVTSLLALSYVISLFSTESDVVVSTARCSHSAQQTSTRSVSRIGYWRSLWSSHDFADEPFEHCIDVVHTDIVDVWRLPNSDGVCLSSSPSSWSLNVVSIFRVPNSRQRCPTLSRLWLSHWPPRRGGEHDSIVIE